MAKQRQTPRRLRERAGLTQMKAAVALDVSLSTIQGMESRGIIPRVDFAEKMAKLYGVSLEEIEWGVKEPGKPGNPKGSAA
jgi:transcriptional regulator with XRE-family HTH domain